MPSRLLCAERPALYFFFTGTATTEIYTLSLHDALPIYHVGGGRVERGDLLQHQPLPDQRLRHRQDRKSTRLNSSHLGISYAVFCLKKKKPRLCCRPCPDERTTVEAFSQRIVLTKLT